MFFKGISYVYLMLVIFVFIEYWIILLGLGFIIIYQSVIVYVLHVAAIMFKVGLVYKVYFRVIWFFFLFECTFWIVII
jgi:hypothetical protein